MSERLTDKALKDIKARIDVFDEGTPQGDGTGNFRNLINDAVLLLNEIDALRARVAELSLTAGEYRLLDAWRSGKWAELLALVSAKIAEEYEQ